MYTVANEECDSHVYLLSSNFILAYKLNFRQNFSMYWWENSREMYDLWEISHCSRRIFNESSREIIHGEGTVESNIFLHFVRKHTRIGCVTKLIKTNE